MISASISVLMISNILPQKVFVSAIWIVLTKRVMISGEEKICNLSLKHLRKIKPYNEEQDAAFYEEPTIEE